MRHAGLPDELVGRIKAFKQILAEVEPSPIEQTIQNFMRDSNPDREIAVWEHVADTYQLYLTHNPTTDLNIKKDIFSVLLQNSMGMEDWSSIKHLTKDQIDNIILNYRRFLLL